MNEVRPKALFLTLVGLAICTLPVITSILLYFPLWKERGAAATLSGFALLLMLFALTPMMKTVRRILRSPASYTMWFIAFVIFFALSKIASEMTVICFVGFVSNIIGALFFKAAKKRGKGEGDDERQV